MKPRTTQRTVEVRADGEGLISHAGAFLLVELADRLGLTAALSEAMAPTRQRRCAHDPGVVPRDLAVAVAVADGGDHVSDLGVLRAQQALFGAVASETTAHRVIKSIDANLLEALRAARAKALERAWDAGARPERIILDIDASLLAAHSEKERAAGNYKGGFAFTRCSATSLRPASRWPACFALAMPAPTAPPITSRSCSSRSSNCPRRYLNYLQPYLRETREGAQMVAEAMATVVAWPEHRAWLRWSDDDLADCKWVIKAAVMKHARVKGERITHEVAYSIARAMAEVVTKNARA